MASGAEMTSTIAASVEQTCFSFAAQRAARAIGRRYDAALRPTGLSNWQFTLMMMLIRDEAPTIGTLAHNLAMDRTTVTANLKPLENRGLLAIQPDAEDRRVRRVIPTDEGRALLSRAYPLWEKAQVACAGQLGKAGQKAFRSAVDTLST